MKCLKSTFLLIITEWDDFEWNSVVYNVNKFQLVDSMLLVRLLHLHCFRTLSKYFSVTRDLVNSGSPRKKNGPMVVANISHLHNFYIYSIQKTVYMYVQ